MRERMDESSEEALFAGVVTASQTEGTEDAPPARLRRVHGGVVACKIRR